MAKRQVKATTKTPAGELPGKVRFEVRFDDDVYQGIKQLADSAQISVNQLMHALARWATQNARPGEPRLDDSDVWLGQTVPQPGTITIGVPGSYRTIDQRELEYLARAEEMSLSEYVDRVGAKTPAFAGKTWTFDFTERRVIREDV